MDKQTLKQYIHYDPSEGVFTRVYTTGNNSKKGDTLTHGRISIQGKSYKLHRLAFLYMTGSIPTEVVHLNGDKTDNRFRNLRGVYKNRR